MPILNKLKIKEILVILACFPILTFYITIIASINSFPDVKPLISDTRDYWPTQEWLNATPESKGMDSKKLNHMIDVIELQGYNIDSVIVVRNGYIVMEEFPSNEYNPTKLHMLQSVTKSFTSTLIGIALHEGFIDSVEQKMVDFFPGRTIANLDSRKKAITLEHLLTMTEGLYWTEHDYPYTDNRNTLKQMWDSSDAIQHILDQPMVREPGERFAYNSGTSILLGAIIEQTTGMDVRTFAEDYLFNLIGIDRYSWALMINSGVLHTDGGLYLTPRDMARLGYLYLNNGTWDGTEILSLRWVSEATRTHYLISYSHGYGYQWWTFPEMNVYFASGHYEQKIYVYPEEDLVVVFTANIADADPHPTDSLFLNHILPATTISEESEAGKEDEMLNHNRGFLIVALTLSFMPGLISIIVVISLYWIARKRRK
jgi:CubicO group peptidase (beta-lactamase class C family)